MILVCLYFEKNHMIASLKLLAATPSPSRPEAASIHITSSTSSTRISTGSTNRSCTWWWQWRSPATAHAATQAIFSAGIPEVALGECRGESKGSYLGEVTGDGKFLFLASAISSLVGHTAAVRSDLGSQ